MIIDTLFKNTLYFTITKTHLQYETDRISSERDQCNKLIQLLSVPQATMFTLFSYNYRSPHTRENFSIVLFDLFWPSDFIPKKQIVATKIMRHTNNFHYHTIQLTLSEQNNKISTSSLKIRWKDDGMIFKIILFNYSYSIKIKIVIQTLERRRYDQETILIRTMFN